jgi:HK97 family phage major capsid protein
MSARKMAMTSAALMASSAMGRDPSLLGRPPGMPQVYLEAPKDQGRDDAKPVTTGDLAAISASIERISGEVKQFAEDMTKKVEAGADKADGAFKDLTEKADKALNEQGELRARLQDLEQRVAMRRDAGQAEAPQSPGQVFSASEELKAFKAKGAKGRCVVDMAAVTTLSVGSALTEPQRLSGFINIPDRRLTVRDLLTPGRTSQNAIQYVKETGFTNNADVVTEGTTKPESDIAFDLETVAVVTIAHFIIASKQILDDVPMLESHIDGRLRYGLAFVEEDQLLNGNGAGGNIHGIIPQATAYAPEFTVDEQTMIDQVRLAILQSELAEFPATGVVLNPIDWTRIELTKDLEGRYIFANPQSTAQATLWSRPVVATKAMDEDEFLVGAFRLGAQVFDREDANVEVSTEDSDNFRKNLVTIRGEERLALAVYRPEAFVYGDFGNVT